MWRRSSLAEDFSIVPLEINFCVAVKNSSDCPDVLHASVVAASTEVAQSLKPFSRRTTIVLDNVVGVGSSALSTHSYFNNNILHS